ncbi:MAG: hypothetical protein A2Z32_06415 [Chloroflexi bacterium RBG_16_69_14]|nr:MAG: hypothetical protein A2Z32_06415 [Chloroflexi bacterium RBG_16_69_14]
MMTIEPAPRIIEPSRAELPAPVSRWLQVAYPDGVPDVDTLVFEGSARIKRGRMPWIPIHARMHHRLGRDHVADMRIKLGPLTLLRVIDASIAGVGISKVGRTADLGPQIDQGAFLFLWGEALIYPSSWPYLPGMRWESVNEATVRVHLPFRGGFEVATLSFDRTTGQVVRFEADRYKGARGTKVRWRGDYLDWRLFDGVLTPGRILVTWLDEPAPWFEMRVERVLADVSIDRALAAAREAIAKAKRR